MPGDRNAFTPFTQEEIETLIETVLSAQAHGISVRSITMTMGEGDKKAMLRYQNKYRSMVKNYPETVLAVYRRMQEEGKDTFNPYSQQRPHKSGPEAGIQPAARGGRNRPGAGEDSPGYQDHRRGGVFTAAGHPGEHGQPGPGQRRLKRSS